MPRRSPSMASSSRSCERFATAGLACKSSWQIRMKEVRNRKGIRKGGKTPAPFFPPRLVPACITLDLLRVASRRVAANEKFLKLVSRNSKLTNHERKPSAPGVSSAGPTNHPGLKFFVCLVCFVVSFRAASRARKQPLTAFPFGLYGSASLVLRLRAGCVVGMPFHLHTLQHAQ